jgi:hypothetical protein
VCDRNFKAMTQNEWPISSLLNRGGSILFQADEVSHAQAMQKPGINTVWSS